MVDLHRIFIAVPPSLTKSNKWEVVSCFAATDEEFDWWIKRKTNIIREDDQFGWTLKEREEVIDWLRANGIEVHELPTEIYNKMIAEKAMTSERWIAKNIKFFDLNK